MTLGRDAVAVLTGESDLWRYVLLLREEVAPEPEPDPELDLLEPDPLELDPLEREPLEREPLEREPLEPEFERRLRLERCPPLRARLCEREPLPLLLALPEASAAPFFAPRTAPLAAPAAKSAVFITPASPYTAPRRNSSLARGDTAAAVAAAIAPVSSFT
ncbi:MAG: hypothetical protein JOZ73_05140 [Solirubrobacterales bacterium]|nr:hypothetical protein [Solirubrobacterales bacterium]